MDPRHLFMDRRLDAKCVYCGGTPDTYDHVPSKVLLDEPYPRQLPVVAACKACNEKFSLDEQYVACFVEAVLSGSVEPSRIARTKVRRILDENVALASRIKASQRTDKQGNRTWYPEIDRVRRIVVKLARGHAAYELYASREDPAEVVFAPFLAMSDDQIAGFENKHDRGFQGWPEIGSRAFFRASGKSPDGFPQTGDWVVVQASRYRYAVYEAPLLVRVVLSEYLACQVVWE